jgi:hypothetical protein
MRDDNLPYHRLEAALRYNFEARGDWDCVDRPHKESCRISQSTVDDVTTQAGCLARDKAMVCGRCRGTCHQPRLDDQAVPLNSKNNPAPS